MLTQSTFAYALGRVSQCQLTSVRRSQRLSAPAPTGSQAAADTAHTATPGKTSSKAAVGEALNVAGPSKAPAVATAVAAAAAAVASPSCTAFAAPSEKADSPTWNEDGGDEVFAAAAAAAGSEALELDWDAMEVEHDGQTYDIAKLIAKSVFM